ncbi:cyclin [Trifolium repens]|nr:putative cyclin-A3-1 [Trifolium repens]WJX35257.1 cyclin [Trifolium repens]
MNHYSKLSTGRIQLSFIFLLVSIIFTWRFFSLVPFSASKISKKKNKKNLTSAETDNGGSIVSEAYNYLLSMEKKRSPMIDYIERVQTDIDPNWRGKCIDWVVSVVDYFNLLPDTLFLAVSCIDRFLSFKPISSSKLHLLCVSSMFIASKYEETFPPRLEKFCRVIKNKYSKEEILEMEIDILKTLNFDMGNPTTKTFLRAFIEIACEKNDDLSLQFEFLSNYLAELSLLDYDCVMLLPSLVAASVTFLARFIVWPETYPWTSSLQEYTGYKPVELKECVIILHDLYMARRKGRLHCSRQKYNRQKYKCVADLPSPTCLPSYLFEVERGSWMKLLFS